MKDLIKFAKGNPNGVDWSKTITPRGQWLSSNDNHDPDKKKLDHHCVIRKGVLRHLPADRVGSAGSLFSCRFLSFWVR